MGGKEYEFRCANCAEEITVNASMREALLEHGCVICGATVADDWFVVLS